MEYKFSDLVNAAEVQSFFNSFFVATDINCAIIDVDGKVVMESGNRNICSQFHKTNPLTLCGCNKTIEYIIEQTRTGKEHTLINCPNGLFSIGIPINIDGRYFATLYCGQFLLEPINESFFLNQCRSCGFDETEYFKALRSTPILDKSKMTSILNLLTGLCRVIGRLGSDALQELKWNNRLTANYQELEATYEELLATEDELRAQFDELQHSQEKLARSEERYKLALLGSHDGIYDWDIPSDSYYYSDKWANMIGYTRKTLPIQGDSYRSLIHPEDVAIFDKELYDYINKITDKYKCEYRIRRKDDTYIWVSDVGAATWDEHGVPVRMVGSHTDITEQKAWSEKIHKMAYYDGLTGLPNKFTLHQQLSALCKEEAEFSVIFMDLDNFKSVNDILSHTFGDNLLKKLSFELSSLIDNRMTLYRWGGDEFVFILRNVGSETELSAFMDKLIRLLNNPLIIDGHELYATASIGACIYPRDSRIPEDLIKHSDTAMYQAKALGKNNYQIYRPDFSAKALEQITLERELRNALKKGEFRVYYQPRIDVRTKKMVGMEALLRWVKADGTIISPLKFIPKAEETGLIIPIGEFVLRTACQDIKRWEDMGYSDLSVSINLSARQMEDMSLINTVRSCLEESRIRPSSIELEITESAAIKDMNQTIALLKELKNMGINVLLDDFGTGYSSLNFLRLLPVTTIKIDKTFIDRVEEESAEKTIVKSLISLAHDIRMRVIAEGIETNSQLDFLQDNLCDEAQGFYFSRPVPVNELEELLKEGF